MSKKALLAAAAILALPAAANAQSLFDSAGPTYPGVYIGAEGGLNWLLNNNSYTDEHRLGRRRQDRLRLRRSAHRDGRPVPSATTAAALSTIPNGSFAFVQRPHQPGLGDGATLLYDFFPGATITPYVGAGAGVAFVDPSIRGLHDLQHAVRLPGHHRHRLQRGARAGASDLDGRYYGTTNPGQYTNNNLSVMLGLTYKFGQPEVAAPPPPPAPAPAAAPSFMVFFDWDRSNLSGQALTDDPARRPAPIKSTGSARITATGHADRSGPDELQHGAVAASRERRQGRAGPRGRAGDRRSRSSARARPSRLVQTGDDVREPQNRRVEIVVQ